MLDSSGFEDTLRPEEGSTGSARVGICDPTTADSLAGDRRISRPNRALLGALDRAMYTRPFVVIDADNHGEPVDSLEAARAALTDATAASAAGRLADGLVAADIDADDPVIGDAVAEALIAWCHRHKLPYLLRDSGRPGGRHVVAVLQDQARATQWAALCRQLAASYGVVVDDRTGAVLRLLTAPHRRGLPSPVLACTITPAIVMDLAARTTGRRGRRRAQPAPGTGSRSETEYGASCAMARAGVDTETAWQEIARRDGKSAERGRDWWVRHMWVSAVTVAAAEDGLDTNTAWQRVRSLCPRIARRWWTPLWTRARAEAAQDRPRRRQLAEPAHDQAQAQATARIDTLRAAFATATEALTGVDPRRRRSVAAALYALSAAIVTRGGSMSTRDLSIRARLDLATVRRALATAVEHGLIVRVHEYAGGADDCHAYAPGPAVTIQAETPAPQSSSLTRGTPRPHGTACPHRLRRAYQRDRMIWRLRNDVLASLAPGERLATSQHPAAKLLRSLWAQRKWWTALTDQQRQQRRTARRAVLAGLHRSDQRRWFAWLDRRQTITAAADALTTNPGRALPPDAARAVLAAPLTVHRGLRDPLWREGGTPAAPTAVAAADQLVLAAA